MNELGEKTSQRIDWVDALKFLGILAIYFGHYGEAGGLGYGFVFEYHVPLFFMISGFFAVKENKNNYFKFVISKAKKLLIPYYLFAIINILFISINSSTVPSGILDMIKQSISGIRNKLMFAPSLWFLPCLFIISILYELLFRIIKNKYYLLLVSLLLYIIAEHFLPNAPTQNPSWFFNIDSALTYIIYYAIGTVIFPFLKNFEFNKQKMYIKIIFLLTSVLVLVELVYIYFKKENILDEIFSIKYMSLFYPIFKACIIIYINILVSKIICKVELINTIGKNTLILCGNETIIKLVANNTIYMCGLQVILHSPLVTMTYTIILLIISCYTIIPLEKKCFSKILDI